MKHKLALFGMIGLASLALTSFTPKTDDDQKEQPKKTRHIKMTKIENGKKTELDTIVYGDDVFVWQGDTIRGKQIGKTTSHSGSDQMQQIIVTGDPEGENENVTIIRHGDAKPGEPMIWNMDNGDDMEIVTENIDSLGKHIVVTKHITDGNDMINRNHHHMMPFPPMPPVPKHNGRVIDLNDPNITSFKIKDMKGGLEKIEIIRKKSSEPEETTFDFHGDDQLMPPPPPEAPEIIREFKNGESEIKIIRKDKELEGKDGKEIKVEVESQETK